MNGVDVGTWTTRQTDPAVWDTLLPEQSERLTALGLAPRATPAAPAGKGKGAGAFERGIVALTQYVTWEGRVVVPRTHIEETPHGSVRLGTWISNTRSRREKLSYRAARAARRTRHRLGPRRPDTRSTRSMAPSSGRPRARRPGRGPDQHGRQAPVVLAHAVTAPRTSRRIMRTLAAGGRPPAPVRDPDWVANRTGSNTDQKRIRGPIGEAGGAAVRARATVARTFSRGSRETVPPRRAGGPLRRGCRRERSGPGLRAGRHVW
ncbi:helicase associated domain-containing protein [Streptomyces microflavus]|uniref:helicase associated domain-containing protein n=1 Tax=Streptomyces microflavus TaxID=1919 RepID=UPI0036987D09